MFLAGRFIQRLDLMVFVAMMHPIESYPFLCCEWYWSGMLYKSTHNTTKKYRSSTYTADHRNVLGKWAWYNVNVTASTRTLKLINCIKAKAKTDTSCLWRQHALHLVDV